MERRREDASWGEEWREVPGSNSGQAGTAREWRRWDGGPAASEASLRKCEERRGLAPDRDLGPATER